MTVKHPIDTEKLIRLWTVWVEHEAWIQDGCPSAATHSIRFPGYGAIAEQDVRGYDIYRHALVPYFADAFGYTGVHGTLLKLLSHLREANSALLDEMLQLYEQPGVRFRAQWGNLFGGVFGDTISHDALSAYQRKFEVELPLFFLAHLREMISKGTFDKNLDRFRDRTGNLKKGSVAQYIVDGFGDYPDLRDIIAKGYRPELRNAVAHNAYSLDDGELRSLDQDLSLSGDDFSETFDALQVLQNAVLWYLASRNSDHIEIGTQGVLSLGWVATHDHRDGLPHVVVYQLAPFHRLDASCGWLSSIVISREGDSLSTQLTNSHTIRGKWVEGLRAVLENVKRLGTIYVAVVPVMPCVHSHEAVQLLDGEYCQAADVRELAVRARVAL